MNITKLEDYKGGWLIGNFDPAVLKTKDFEVSVKIHPKGEKWPKHYHRVATEYNVLISGEMSLYVTDKAGNTTVYLLHPHDVFVIYPEEIVEPNFYEDCTIMCVKVPSVIGDKYECD